MVSFRKGCVWMMNHFKPNTYLKVVLPIKDTKEPIVAIC